MSLTILTIIALSLSLIALIVAIVGFKKSSLTRTLKIWFAQESAPETLQEVLLKIADKIERLVNTQKQQAERIEQMTAILNTTIRHVGIVRFDSGSSDGGNLSFSLALLDNSQSGVVFTSLHGREHNRVYVKSIINGSSPSTLSEEETQAIIQSLSNKDAPNTEKQKTTKRGITKTKIN